MSKLCKIGFIGAGDISLLHAAAIEHCAGAELVGVWSIDDFLNREKSEQFDCEIYESAEALVNDSRVDAVFIHTNLETHCEYGWLAMNAGKHVLIEKPVAVSVAELKSLQACAEENKVILCPGKA